MTQAGSRFSSTAQRGLVKSTSVMVRMERELLFRGELISISDAPPEVKASHDLTGRVGRVGSTALIAFSIITFIMSVLLPFFVQSPEDEKAPGFTPRPPKSIAGIVTGIEKYKPSLLTAWTVAHCIFASSMIMAPFVRSLRSATLIIAACGV